MPLPTFLPVFAVYLFSAESRGRLFFFFSVFFRGVAFSVDRTFLLGRHIMAALLFPVLPQATAYFL